MRPSSLTLKLVILMLALTAFAFAPSVTATAGAAEPLRIVVAGNSIARAQGWVRLESSWSYQLVQRLDPGSAIETGTVQLPSGWRGFVLRSRSIVLVNAARPGQRTSTTAYNFERDVMRFRPDVVLVISGTNDIAHDVPAATTRTAFTRMRRLASAGNARLIWATVPIYWWDDPTLREPRRAALNSWLLTTGGADAADISARLRLYMLLDRGHFNVTGNTRIAETFAPMLMPK